MPNTGSSPTVSGNVVYIVSNDGKLQAFNAAGCGRATCTPLWTGSIGGTSGDGAPAVANGVVYVTSGSRLFAFPAGGCGRATCSPTWRSIAAAGFIQHSGPTVDNGNVYFASVNFSGPNGTVSTVYAFPAAGCGAFTCRPRWVAHPADGDGIESTLAVANGVLYATATGFLYAFNANGCGRSVCGFLWLGILDGMVAGSRSSPTVAAGVVYFVQNNGHIGAFDARGCGARTCVQIWSAITQDFDALLATPVIVDGRLYAAGPAFAQRPSIYVYHLV